MPLSVEGTATTATGLATTLTVNKPTSGVTVQNDDYLVALLTKDNDPAWVTLAGWTEAVQVNSLLGNDMSMAALYKKITDASGEPADYTFAHGADSQEHSGTIFVIRGADLTTFMDVTPTTAEWLNDPTPDTPSITPVTDDNIVIACAALSHTSVTSITEPTGYTAIAAVVQDWANMGVAFEAQTTAAATGAVTWTFSGGSVNAEAIGIHLAIRPAVAGGGSGVTSRSFGRGIARGINRGLTHAMTEVNGLWQPRRVISISIQPQG